MLSHGRVLGRTSIDRQWRGLLPSGHAHPQLPVIGHILISDFGWHVAADISFSRGQVPLHGIQHSQILPHAGRCLRLGSRAFQHFNRLWQAAGLRQGEREIIHHDGIFRRQCQGLAVTPLGLVIHAHPVVGDSKSDLDIPTLVIQFGVHPGQRIDRFQGLAQRQLHLTEFGPKIRILGREFQ